MDMLEKNPSNPDNLEAGIRFIRRVQRFPKSPDKEMRARHTFAMDSRQALFSISANRPQANLFMGRMGGMDCRSKGLLQHT